MENKILVGIMAFSILFLVVSLLRYSKELLMKGAVRLFLGLSAIYGMNWAASLLGMAIYVGINPFSGLIVMFLGAPGILLLYGIELYFNMVYL